MEKPVGSNPEVNGCVVTRESLSSQFKCLANGNNVKPLWFLLGTTLSKSLRIERKPDQKMSNVRRLSPWIIGTLVAGLITVTLPLVSATSGATNSHAKTPTLLSLVVSGPAGFVSDSKDQTSGGATGRIQFSEATFTDCDPAGLTHGIWVASVLRYFDNNPADPESYVILCVTQLRNASDAVKNRNAVAALGGSKAPASIHVPSAHLNTVGPANQISFSKGNYFVWVVAVDLTSLPKGLAIASNVALREYARLPK